MATEAIGNYTAANSIDGSTNFLLIQPGNSSTAYNKINRNVFLGVTGQPVDISTSQTLSNKTIGNTNSITVKDASFTLQDDSDTSKQAQFQLSGITTATTRTYTLPNASSTLADIATAQTLTNKILTAPVISGGSIDNATVTVDAISGHTTANSGTIYGLAVTSSKISGTSITSGTITGTQVVSGFAVQQVSVLSTVVATGTTVIPIDDTTPQNTEGDQYMNLAITPKSASNTLVIQIVAMLANSAATPYLVGTLFQDSTVGALAAGLQQTTANSPLMFNLVYTMAAGTTSATTFKFRAGGGGAGTTTFNGQAAGRFFGAIAKSSIVITEYKV